MNDVVSTLIDNGSWPWSKELTTVVCFGTFDLFHPLHARLLQATTRYANSLLVYVYGKDVKRGNTKLTDNATTRIINVTRCASQWYKGSHLRVQRMVKKHIEQLTDTINEIGADGMVLMGGADQFADYPALHELCRDRHVPVISIDRGSGLCSSDLRLQPYYKRAALCYGVDVPHTFWNSFKGQLLERDEQMRLWRYTPDQCIDQQVKNPLSADEGRVVVCLPGRTKCDWNRARKILRTNQEMLSNHQVGIYLCNYSEDGVSTSHHLQRLVESPRGYMSRDALEFARLVLMPRIKNNTLWQVTLWGRSRGAVFAIEVENAFFWLCAMAGYGRDQIEELARQVAVCCVSNLAPFNPHRLFSTYSITGINDKKAIEYIPELTTRGDLRGDLELSATHHVYLVIIPREIWTNDHGTIVHVEDDDCHYTPLFIAPREPQTEDNTLHHLVMSVFSNMVGRSENMKCARLFAS